MWRYLKKTNSPSKKAPPSTAGPSSSKSDSNPHQAQPQAQPVPETPSSSSSSSEVEPKKERQFKTAWKVNRPWLKYEEGLMFCLVCRDHAHRYPSDTVQHRTFIDGTPPTKIDRIKSHETSKYHLNALEKAKKKPAAARESVAGKTYAGLLANKKGLNKVVTLFRNAHAIVRNARPFTDIYVI